MAQIEYPAWMQQKLAPKKPKKEPKPKVVVGGASNLKYQVSGWVNGHSLELGSGYDGVCYIIVLKI